MSVFLGIDIGTSGTKTLAIDEQRANPGLGHGDLSLLSSQAAVERARSRRLVAGDRQHGPQAVMAKAKLKPADVKAIGLSGQMHGSVFLGQATTASIRRAILWNDQRTAAECAEIEQRAGGRREPHQAGRQSGADRLHRPENPLAAEPRATEFRQDPQGAAAQGRHPPPADRRIRHRSERRQRHAAVGRGQARLVEAAARATRTRSRPAGQLLRIGRSDRPAHARRRPANWA